LASGAKGCGFESLLAYKAKFNVSIERLPILEAFLICLSRQMWTLLDKNRTPKLPGVYGTFSVGSLLFFSLQKFSDPFIFVT